MTRFDILDAARDAVTQREGAYGGPEDNARQIAALWSAYLGHEIAPVHVGPMMALLKIARIRHDPTHADSWVDVAGYAAYGAEVSLNSSEG
jgi:hypothetical protein